MSEVITVDEQLQILADEINAIEAEEEGHKRQLKLYSCRAAYYKGVRVKAARKLLKADQAFGKWCDQNFDLNIGYLNRLKDYADFADRNGLAPVVPDLKKGTTDKPELIDLMPEKAVRELHKAPESIQKEAISLAKSGKKLVAPTIAVAVEHNDPAVLGMSKKERDAYVDEKRGARIDTDGSDEIIDNMLHGVKRNFSALETKLMPSAINPSLAMKPAEAIEYLKSKLPVGMASSSNSTEVCRREDGFYELKLVNSHYDRKMKGSPDKFNYKFAVPLTVTITIEVGDE